MSEVDLLAVLARLERIERKLDALKPPPSPRTARRLRIERRAHLFASLATGLGLGPTMVAATQIADMLGDKAEAPAGCARELERLRGDEECPRSARQIYRILKGES